MPARSHLAAVALVLAAVGQAASPPSLRLEGPTMGTRWSVEVAHPPPGLAPERLRAAIVRRLDAIDAAMSTWRTDSTLARFNASPSTAWTPVDADTARVAAEALRIGRWSGGALDPTVLPLVTLWGFGAAGPVWRPPAPAAIVAARARTGLAALAVRRTDPALRKRRRDVAVDLSAVAKGFAADAVAAELRGLGARDVLVEIGGELRGSGRNAHGEPWIVAVEAPPGHRPGSSPGAVAVVRLGDDGIATSGDYRHHFDAGGRRYSHVVDPRTGAPIAHALAAVSVIARTAMRADALATALLVLGPIEGPARARRDGLAALFVLRGPDGPTVVVTPAFAARRLDGTERAP